MLLNSFKKIFIIASINAFLLVIGNYSYGTQGTAIAFVVALTINNLILRKGIV